MMYQKMKNSVLPHPLYKCIVVLCAVAAFILTACSGLQEDGGEKNIRINLPPIEQPASGNSRALLGDRLPMLKTETRRYRVTVNGMTREGTGSSYEFTLAVGIRATAIIECLNSSGEVIIRAVKDFTVSGGENSIDINLKNDGNEIIPSAPQPVPNQVTYSYGEATLGNPSGLPSDPATYNEGDLFTVADGANMTWQHGLNGGGFTEWITNVALEGDDASSTADVQAGNAVIVNGKYKMPAGGVTLTAQWTKTKYSLTYDDNVPAGKSGTVSGKPADQTQQDALTKVTVGGGQPTLTVSSEVWNFKGYWTDDAAGSGTRYSAGQEITLTGDTTLYAQWTNEAVWRVSFAEPNNNKPSAYTTAMPTNDVVKQGQPFSWTANPAATGWTFGGWDVNDGSAIPTALDFATTEVTPNSDITLTAKWTANTYTINLNTSNSNWSGATGTISGNATVPATYDTAATLPAITAPTGYTFAGWTRTSGGTTADNTITQSGGIYTATNLSSTKGATVDLYPVWTVNTYAVTVSAGSSVPSSEVSNLPNLGTQNYNATVQLGTDPTRTGYTFAGWGVTPTSVSIIGSANVRSFTMPAEPVTLTAQWTPDTYTIVFNAGTGGSGSGQSNMTFNVTSTETLPEKPDVKFTSTQQYKFFSHWAKTNSNSASAVTLSEIINLIKNNNTSSLSMSGKNITLYAVWGDPDAEDAATMIANYTNTSTPLTITFRDGVTDFTAVRTALMTKKNAEADTRNPTIKFVLDFSNTTLETIPDEAFGTDGTGSTNACTNISEVKLPSTLKTIGNGAFGYTYIGGTLTIPNGVTSIGTHAFSYADFTGDIVIPDTVTELKDNAFSYMSCTGSLTLPSTLTSIDRSVFWGSSFTGTLNIPSSLKNIPYGLFSQNNFTGNLVIPDGVTSIGRQAFYGCYGFNGILSIPSSVTKIDSEAFSLRSPGAFSSVTFTGTKEQWNAITYSSDATESGKKDLAGLTINYSGGSATLNSDGNIP